jgi:hypothetical protein
MYKSFWDTLYDAFLILQQLKYAASLTPKPNDRHDHNSYLYTLQLYKPTYRITKLSFRP